MVSLMVPANTPYIVLKAIQQLLIRIRHRQNGMSDFAALQLLQIAGIVVLVPAVPLYTPELLVTWQKYQLTQLSVLITHRLLMLLKPVVVMAGIVIMELPILLH